MSGSQKLNKIVNEIKSENKTNNRINKHKIHIWNEVYLSAKMVFEFSEEYFREKYGKIPFIVSKIDYENFTFEGDIIFYESSCDFVNKINVNLDKIADEVVNDESKKYEKSITQKLMPYISNMERYIKCEYAKSFIDKIEKGNYFITDRGVMIKISSFNKDEKGDNKYKVKGYFVIKRNKRLKIGFNYILI